MADQIIITDASVEVDDETWPISGNTLSFQEGQGEASIESATQGGATVMVISVDESTKVGMVKFDMPSSVDAMNKTRDTKALGSGRVVRISGTDSAGNRLGRTFRSAIIVSDPEKSIQNEGKLSVEFKSAPAVSS